jgi:L-2-hydroxyglutarate oxidase LhgO
MPTWTTPKTWSTGEALSANDMNTHIRDNLGALKAPPTAAYTPDEAANYNTSQTTFVDVDASNLALTITTTGGDVMVGFHGHIFANGGICHLDVEVDGTREAGDDGITAVYTNNHEAVSFTLLITNLDAGSHTFKLQWKVTAGSAALYAGAGTANLDVHPQFWVREI